MAMPDLQRYPWKLIDQNVEHVVSVLTWKVLISVIFSIASDKQEIHKSLSQSNHAKWK